MKTKLLPLILSFFLFACGLPISDQMLSSPPQTAPTVADPVDETITSSSIMPEPTISGIVKDTKADDYAIFSINVQDFSYPAQSATILDRIITLHESYNMPVDIYLTDTIAKIYAEQYPELIQRLITSPVVAISYHYRAPRPYASGNDWLGLDNMSEENLYQTIMRYETHAVDPVSGQTTEEAGGYQYVASLIGYAPYAASSLSSSRKVDDALMRVFKELGAQMTVVHGRANNLGDIKKNLIVRPEQYDYMLFQHIGEDAAQSYEAALLNAHNAQGAVAPYFVGIKMHDNDFFAAKSAWLTVYVEGGKRAPWNPELKTALLSQIEQDAMWAMYEQTVTYVASQQGRITPVNLPTILNMLSN